MEKQIVARTKDGDLEFCRNCGKSVNKDSVICPHCGVQLKELQTKSIVKQKSTAVILAVFLGLWTWAYTYRVDSWKFWLNLCLSFITLGIWGLLVAWPWAIIESSVRKSSFYDKFPV